MESYWVVKGSGVTSGTHLWWDPFLSSERSGQKRETCVGAHLVEEELVVLVREVVVRLDDLV